MNEKGLLDWLAKRKEDTVHDGIRVHALAVLDAVMETDNAFKFARDGDYVAAAKCVDRLNLSEREADRLEDKLCSDIVGGELSSQEREDLIHFVRKLDQIANWSKESSIYLQIVMDTKFVITVTYWDQLIKITNELITAVKYLIKALDSIKTNEAETIRHLDAVIDQERIIDSLFYDAIKLAHMSEMEPKAVMLGTDIVRCLELCADTCKACADTINILLVSRRT